jgi:5'-3' exonuclease
MLILDFSSVIIAALHVQVGFNNMREVEEDLLRHMILNTIRSIRTKFKSHGEIVIACDMGSWRKEVYPYYKANRKKAKDASGLDWKKIFEIFTRMRNDLKEYFPYRVIEVQNAEADDIISTLVARYGNPLPLADGSEDILIMSPDKDFAQLHTYSNVKQYDPIRKKWISVPDPDLFLREQIISGDSVDGVPNIMSDDDTFIVEGKRQKTMTAKRKAAFLEAIPEEFQRGFERNTMMIDLGNTPFDIQQAVMAEYDAQAGKGRSKIFSYFMKHRLRNLTESMGDF